MEKIRYNLVDQVRGFAVVIMIIFHLGFDLNAFGFAQLDFHNGGFWFIFPRIIVTFFMLAVGLSLPLVHTPTIDWRRFWKRFGLIILCAAGISLSTFIMYPSRWIYFGTLHSIALCSLLALPFLRRPWISLATGMALILPALLWQKSIPWFQLPHRSLDYIPPFPWVGVVLVGIFLWHRGVHKLKMPTIKPLEFLGRHSLIIYLIHQPIMFSAVWLLHQLFVANNGQS